MKLYTKSGDDGSTGLYGPMRVGKDHPRIETYGTVDELNAWIGMCASACDCSDKAEHRMREILSSIQSRLFDLGADLATPQGASTAMSVPRINERHVAEAEGFIDEIDGANTPLSAFVLPGGSELAARLHVARTVCRRGERLLVALGRNEDLGPYPIQYLNRLSDLLFAMARGANRVRGVDDMPWQKDA